MPMVKFSRQEHISSQRQRYLQSRMSQISHLTGTYDYLNDVEKSKKLYFVLFDFKLNYVLSRNTNSKKTVSNNEIIQILFLQVQQIQYTIPPPQ